MSMIISFGERIALAVALTLIWTEWYLPIEISIAKYITTGQCTLSILWILHLSIRYPLAPPSRKEQLKGYLPKYR